MTPSILIIEDDPAIAAALQYALERESWHVTWLTTASQVAPTLASLPLVSAIILDVGLPDGHGFDVCQSIRFGQYHAHVPILFLTARDDEIDRILGLEMGADDYITKPFSPREIIARLKAIWRRELRYGFDPNDTGKSSNMSAWLNAKNPWVSPATSVQTTHDFDKVLPSGRWQYQDRIYQLTWNGQILPLSKTELAIMLALLAQPNHILSREQILTAMTDYPEHRLARTIDSHIKTLRQKLAQIEPSTEVIITHRGLGYGLYKG